MGGAIDWGALPVVADLMGIDDIEDLVTRLATIRDWQATNGG